MGAQELIQVYLGATRWLSITRFKAKLGGCSYERFTVSCFLSIAMPLFLRAKSKPFGNEKSCPSQL